MFDIFWCYLSYTILSGFLIPLKKHNQPAHWGTLGAGHVRTCIYTHRGNVLFVYLWKWLCGKYQICLKLAHRMTSLPVPKSVSDAKVWKATKYILCKQCLSPARYERTALTKMFIYLLYSGPSVQRASVSAFAFIHNKIQQSCSVYFWK